MLLLVVAEEDRRDRPEHPVDRQRTAISRIATSLGARGVSMICGRRGGAMGPIDGRRVIPVPIPK